MFVTIATLFLFTAVAAQTDPCKVAHTDQASCDADKKTGGGCTWVIILFVHIFYTKSPSLFLIHSFFFFPTLFSSFLLLSSASVVRFPLPAGHFPTPRSSHLVSTSVMLLHPTPPRLLTDTHIKSKISCQETLALSLSPCHLLTVVQTGRRMMWHKLQSLVQHRKKFLLVLSNIKFLKLKSKVSSLPEILRTLW